MPLMAALGTKGTQTVNIGAIFPIIKPPEFHIAETTIRRFVVFTAGLTATI